MKKNKTKEQQIHKIIVGGLRDTINMHGQIDKTLIGSAAKRITGALLSSVLGKEVTNKPDPVEEKNDSLCSDAK